MPLTIRSLRHTTARKRSVALAVCSGLAMTIQAVPSLAEEPDWKQRDARELAPAALMGPWKADIVASKYDGEKPRKALRFFAYTGEGKVLVTFMTLKADGRFSSGHWAAQLDGSPALEYYGGAGSTPFNVVNFTRVDDHNFKILVTRNGDTWLHGTYHLSDDNQTLTYAYEGNTIVYHRWVGMD